jgi:hypothetical protein
MEPPRRYSPQRPKKPRSHTLPNAKVTNNEKAREHAAADAACADAGGMLQERALPSSGEPLHSGACLGVRTQSDMRGLLWPPALGSNPVSLTGFDVQRSVTLRLWRSQLEGTGGSLAWPGLKRSNGLAVGLFDPDRHGVWAD